MNTAFLMAALLCGQPEKAPDEPTTDTVECWIEDIGVLFPVVVEIDQGTKNRVEHRYYGGSKTIRIPTGTHTVSVRNSRFGFPQMAGYWIVSDDKETKIWRCANTADPVRVTLEKGQRLVIDVYPPLESYNAKFGKLHGVPVGIVWARPYWFYDVNRDWAALNAPEDYPNSLFFLVDEEKWGPDKVFADLAKFVVGNVTNPKYAGAPEDHRSICHVMFIAGTDRNGKFPKAFTEVDPKKLEADIKAKCLELYGRMLRENCYREFSRADVQALKKAGYLPETLPDDRAVVTFAQGVEYAKPLLKQWREKNEK